MSPIMSRCLVAGMVILATACSSGTAAHSPPAVSVPTGVARCDLPSLTIAFKNQQGAMGGLRVDTFVMTNTSQSPCTLYGYVGMQMLGPPGNAMRTNVVRNGGNVSAVNPGPTLVTLQPGASASFLAAWRAWFDGGTTCAAASQLEITPPDAYDHVTIFVTWGLAPCNSGEIDVTAVAPGTGT